MKNERKQRNLTKTAGKTCRRLLSGLLAAVMALYALPAGAVTFSDDDIRQRRAGQLYL